MAILHRLAQPTPSLGNPQPGDRPIAEFFSIPDGAAGIAATLDKMVEWTKEYRTDLTLRHLGEAIIAAIPGKNYFAEIEAVQEWVRNNVRYTQDIADVETLRSPLALVFNPFGDCDDQALLVGTLLSTLGHPVRYVAVGSIPGEYEHVYVETKIAQRWIGVETTEPVCLGWIPPDVNSRMVRHV